jgi:Tfp pilus assembly protein PilF
MDYFAVSLPDLLIFEEDMQKRHETECRYLIGLGYLGLGDKEKAKSEFDTILQTNRFHQGANVHINMIDNKNILG